MKKSLVTRLILTMALFMSFSTSFARVEKKEQTKAKVIGNLGNTKDNDRKKTVYNKDLINFGVYGCDIVLGPDSTYGSYVIEDGYISPGQDDDTHLLPGTVLPVGKNGGFTIVCGHDRTQAAADWWKSNLTVRQIPTNKLYDDLHYALRGTLTIWVSNYRFGTIDPVKLVLKDFCVSHGNAKNPFIQIASKQFYSHSAFSIVGYVPVNGRKTRVYIESKHNGMDNYINVCPMRASDLSWMSRLPDSRTLSRVSIPGTHDSGSASLPENKLTSMAHTQNFTISEQLEDGIRAFDIRLKESMKYGHTLECRDGLPETLEHISKFLRDHPSEFIVAIIGSDEGGKWSPVMKNNFEALLKKYPGLFVENFNPLTTVGSVRGKILVIKRQEGCPFGKLLRFQENTIFEDNGFVVEDIYKEHKTKLKLDIVETQLKAAYESNDFSKWYLTFNSIAWDPRHHKPYYSAWGARNISKPMNPSLREVIELKGYAHFGIIFLDFYNDHCDKPQLVRSIIESNQSSDVDKDYVPMQ